MSKVTGIIEKVWENAVKTRTGHATAYSIVVEGTKYSCGFKLPPGVVEGANVSFGTVVNGNYTNADTKTMEVLAPPTAHTATPAPKGGTSAEARQEVIVYQSSRNAAIAVVDIMERAGAIKLPAKQADKYDAMVALVGLLTDEFHCDAMDVYTGNMVVNRELLGDPTTERDD